MHIHNTAFKTFVAYLTDIVFPRRAETKILEEMSIEKLLAVLPLSQTSPHQYIESIFEYHHPLVKRFIWEIKHTGNTVLVEKIGAHMHDMLLEKLSNDALFSNTRVPLLVPIPMSRERKKKRGFNQAELLAYSIYRNGNGTYEKVANVLKHRNISIPQKSIKNRQARLQNMKDEFVVKNPGLISGKDVILVDDVTTTGATLKEARRALKSAGAKKVYAITVAH